MTQDKVNKILGTEPPVALIVGASSGMGKELARQMVQEGYHVAVVARRQNLLDELVEELNHDREKPVAFAFAHDVTHYDEVPDLFERITNTMRGMDVVVFAAGIMPDVGLENFDFETYRKIIDVNVLGAMAWLNQAASRFVHTGHGTIVGISSVAGDRGRQGNPPYATSKAALTTYLESLRNRLASHGVHVVTIKPGPVHTPMTAHLPKLPLPIHADKAAQLIVKAIAKKRGEVYVPGRWRPIMAIIRNIPSFIFRRMKF
ncbi:MAG: SDR family NAD(P)-dependent oxidoreductase [Deltaproteobacteria bacterium]|nr:MAG: SDR family NAD(P)-dependent oxidoreductase [Deltaproteobacteria bacterium]